jgi:hypothetical protein
MSLSYATKARLLSALIPVVIVGGFVVFGRLSNVSIFALTQAPAGIKLYVDQQQYAVGQQINVTVANTTSRTVYVNNNCPYQPFTVYRYSDGQWLSISATTDASKCVGETHAYPVPAHRSVVTDYQYWMGLFNQPGSYRIVANIESYSGGPNVTFQVVD